MIRRPPRSTRTDTLFPYTTLFRSAGGCSTGSVPPPSLTDTHCLAQLPTELVGLRPDPETKEGGARILRPDAALTAVPVEGAALSDKPCPNKPVQVIIVAVLLMWMRGQIGRASCRERVCQYV